MNRRELFKLFGALPFSPLLLGEMQESKIYPIPLGTRRNGHVYCQVIGDVVNE